MENFVYKIRNKKTGQFADGHGAYWSDDFVNTTNYNSVGPPKAIITKEKKDLERDIKRLEHIKKSTPLPSYFSEEAWNKSIQAKKEWIENAEIVRCRLVIDIVDEDGKVIQ